MIPSELVLKMKDISSSSIYYCLNYEIGERKQLKSQLQHQHYLFVDTDTA